MRHALSLLLLPLGVAASGCNEGYVEVRPGPKPIIVTVTGPTGSAVSCDPEVTGPTCPLPLDISFRLPADQFVWKAIVRFQGDGNDDGVDRSYLVPATFGKDGLESTVRVDAIVPPNILRQGALFSYTVRLVTGLGEESTAPKLTVTVR